MSMSGIYTCIECDNNYDDTDGDLDERMCNYCIDKLDEEEEISNRKSAKMNNPSRRGRRNRQRGAELQRQIVRMAKELQLPAWNRDRGGAQHEQGDIEICTNYFGCKRRKTMAKWLKPEKQEIGVFIREDYGEPYVVLPADWFLELMSITSKELKDEDS